MGKATAAIIITGTLGLSGCVFTPFFTPTTKEGAECKHECAMANSGCGGSSYSCDKARSLCISSCKDMERVRGLK